MRRLLDWVTAHRIAALWFVFLAITFTVSIVVLNPTLDPSKSIFGWPQLELQFSYTPDNGDQVLQSWGGDARARYLGYIWIDILFALSYGPFFTMLLRSLGARGFWSFIPLIEMCTNLTETSLEMWWVNSHTEANPMFAVFLTHSLIATVKWALVPIYLWHSGALIYRAAKRGRPNRHDAERTDKRGDLISTTR
jgi:hypothetical protein